MASEKVLYKAKDGTLINLSTKVINNTTTDSTTDALSAAQGKVLASKFTTLTKSSVGLGNVDNTADSAKSVKYAASAGSANAVTWNNVTGKPTTFTPADHTHNQYALAKRVDALDEQKLDKTGLVIIDNLNDTSTDKVLSANQGKVLNSRIYNEAIIRQKYVVSQNTDWDTVTPPGIYKVQTDGNFNDHKIYHSPNEYNSNIYAYGNLIVLSSLNDTAEYRTIQIYIPHQSSDPVLRISNAGTFTAWRSFVEYSIGKSMADLTAGVSELASGKLYFVYE